MTLATLALLHSPLTSATAWGDLPSALSDLGYPVVVPEVLDDDDPPFAQRYIARASLQLANDAPGQPLILLGHSGAGPLLPQVGFARHAAGLRIKGYIFIDAMLPRVPQATTRLEILTLDDAAAAHSITEQLQHGGQFPNWTEAALANDIPDPAHRALLLAGLRPRALPFFTEPLPVPEDWPDARCGYLQLSNAYRGPARTAELRGWSVDRIDAHHFAALTNPDRVATAITRLLDQL